MKRFAFSWLVAAALGGSATTALAEGTYPSQPLNLIVPFSAGSQPDILARAMADGLSTTLGRPVLVLNKEGASGVIAVAAVAAAAPTGYTLGFGPPGQFSTQPHLRKNLGYTLGSFEFICQTNSAAFVIAVGPGSAYQSLGQWLDAARAAPGKLTFATLGFAVSPHLIVESIAQEADVKLTNVPFKNSGDMVVQTINGSVAAVSSTPVVLVPGSGVRPLVVISQDRLAAFPETPTLRELGFKRYDFPGLVALGVYAPRGIPAEVSRTLRAACAKAVELPVARAAATKTSSPVAYADGPVYGERLEQGYRDVGALLDSLGIKEE